jgi:hypothetical protein
MSKRKQLLTIKPTNRIQTNRVGYGINRNLQRSHNITIVNLIYIKMTVIPLRIRTDKNFTLLVCFETTPPLVLASDSIA